MQGRKKKEKQKQKKYRVMCGKKSCQEIFQDRFLSEIIWTECGSTLQQCHPDKCYPQRLQAWRPAACARERETAWI